MRSSGVTVLFVTHATESVVKLCNKALFMESGQIVVIGEPKDIVNRYLESLFSNDQGKNITSRTNKKSSASISKKRVPEKLSFNRDPEIDECKQRPTYNKSEFRWGDGRARIIDYLLVSDGKEVGHSIMRGKTIEVRMMVYFVNSLSDMIYGLSVKTVDGTTVYGTNSRLQKIPVRQRRASELVAVTFRFDLNLIHSEYFLSLGVAVEDEAKDNIAVDRRYDLVHLRVSGEDDAFGLADLNASIEENSLIEIDFNLEQVDNK